MRKKATINKSKLSQYKLYLQAKLTPLFNKLNQNKSASFIGDCSGIAVFEMLPLLAVFIILFGLTFGFWQSIHSGTLRSIAARHYAFEVINNRAHIVYHRDTIAPTGKKEYYRKNGFRFFASVQRQQSAASADMKAQKVRLNLFDSGGTKISDPSEPNQVNPIWLKISYGICLNCDCGDVDPSC